MSIGKYSFKKVDSIVFGVLSPKMIKKMASVKIVTPELYDKEGYPVDGGLMDIRLGVIDPGLRCKTCGSKLKECIGHFGYIEMARPVIHYKFVSQMLNLLRTTCRECGKILMSQNDLKSNLKKLRKVEHLFGLEERRILTKSLILKTKTINKCPHCKARQQKITLEKPTTFLENDKRISPIEIRTRLEKIPDEDGELLGLRTGSIRPEWMVLTVLSVPPVTMRPSITLQSGQRAEDDLTHKLSDIVRINQRLFENINAGAPEIIVEDLWDLLQYHITTFFDNNVAQLPPARHRSGQPLKTLKERVESKEGRIRHNLAGKRTNYSSRTVISPDPMLHLNEVGVPIMVAKKLTIPERVTEWNMEYLKKFVERGPKTYPGANYVVRPDGKKKTITDETKEQLLEDMKPGFLVERHLMDGDVAIFNRQPSLHRMSMMCHKVKVLPYKTFRLNPSVCYPYNADFDGDEMNLHIPQTEEARAEAQTLMLVETQIVSPAYGLSIIGCLFDSVSGNYVLTKDLEFPRKDAIDILFQVGVEDFSRLPGKKMITGKEIFSVIMPEDFNFIAVTMKGDNVKIKKGELVEGFIDNITIGRGSGLIFRKLHRKYGINKTVDILVKVMKLGIEILRKVGLTSSISDTDLPTSSINQIQKILEESYAEVNNYIDQWRQGNLEAYPGRTIKETLELMILRKLNKAREDTGNLVLDTADKRSGTSIMADSGARGKPANLSSMAGMVGQLAVKGKRIEKGYYHRALPLFKKHDLSPAAHGFIKSCYKSGMLPQEFFFITMTGRDSLMDVALRTPKSGYLYRRLANAMQDLRVEYDNTVRDASGKIVQFSYGEDGIDVSKSENGILNMKSIVEK
tara:strand:- start:39441 stop:42005 length:2565 start_codon:yes stop_codon:yes gene_type:complete